MHWTRKTVEPQKTESAPRREAIPLGEVAIRATDALDLLYSLKAYEFPTPEIEAIEKALPEATAQIDLEQAETKTILENLPTLFGLQAGQERWRQLQQKIAGWLRVTTGRATQLRDSVHHLNDLHKAWAQTLPTAAASQESDHVIQEIESTLAAIEVTQRALQPRLDTILALQSRIAREKVRCDRIIAEIAEAQRKGVKGITSRDLPIWSADLWSPTQSMLRCTCPSNGTLLLGRYITVCPRPLKRNAISHRPLCGIGCSVQCRQTRCRPFGNGGQGLAAFRKSVRPALCIRAACPHGAWRISLFAGAYCCPRAIFNLYRLADDPSFATGG